VAASGAVDVVVCMRETLLHLPDHHAVEALFQCAAAALAAEGTLVLSYRDLTGALEGIDRFFRSAPMRTASCCVRSITTKPRTVTVTDVVYTRAGEGWDLNKSSYRKLRIGPDEVVGRLEAAGLSFTTTRRRRTGCG
jgi:hypothetical protein